MYKNPLSICNEMKTIRLLRNGDKYDYIQKLTLKSNINKIDDLIKQIKSLLNINLKSEITFTLYTYQGSLFTEYCLENVNLSVYSSIIFYTTTGKQPS